MERGILDAVLGIGGPDDDFLLGAEDAEPGTLEIGEVAAVGEEAGPVGGGKGVELDVAEAPGLPVAVGGDDLAGEDGAYGGFKELEELLRDRRQRDVRHLHGGESATHRKERSEWNPTVERQGV